MLLRDASVASRTVLRDAPSAFRMDLRNRTEQAEFFFRFRSCESVGLRRETSAPSRAFGGMKSLPLSTRQSVRPVNR